MKRTENSYEIIDVSDITNVRFYTSIDQGSYIPPHWHRAVEIIYMQEGSLDITVESRSFTIHPGDCTLINANVLHSTKCTNPNRRSFCRSLLILWKNTISVHMTRPVMRGWFAMY